MTILVVVIAVLVVLAILNVVLFKGAFGINVSTVINRPPSEVFAKVADLRSWPQWSPWLIHEPDCLIKYSTEPPVNEAGGNYSWYGKKVGEGKMTHKEIDAPNSIVQQIEFIKPFKASNTVTWKFEAEGEGTKVSWGMSGKMPFLFRFLTKMMTGFLNKDYSFGLQLLKQDLDPDAPRMDLTFHGVSDRPEIRCAQHRYVGALQNMADAWQQHSPKMFEVAKDADGNLPGMPLSVYNKVDEKAGTVDVEICLPTTQETVGDYGIFNVSGGLYAKTTLRGDYEMLQYAWHGAFGNLRLNKLKYDKGRKPYEVYENDPRKVSDKNDLETTIYIPVKG